MLHFTDPADHLGKLPGPRLRVARQVAAALLAIGVPATPGCFQALGQEVKTPPASTTAQSELCALAGTVTDSSGAAVQKATITIMNLDTGAVRDLTTNQAGQYAVEDLRAGRYTVRAVAPGFRILEKAGIVLKAGDHQRADFVLNVSDWGCCEYAAAPLTVPEVIFTEKEKPFVYVVGEAADKNTFQGIAKVVYGNPRMWVQIFEANRSVVPKPGFIPNGTSLLIPPRKRVVPKLVSKVMPAYPPTAAKEHVSGDVVLDVTLKEDGTVERADLIDGPPLLVEAATSAVKQWRYQPLLVKGNPVLKFVVVLSFGKDGKVR